MKVVIMPLAVCIKPELALIVNVQSHGARELRHICQQPSLVSTFNKTLSLLTIAISYGNRFHVHVFVIRVLSFLDINLEHFFV